MIAEWDRKRTYIERIRGQRKRRSIAKRFRAVKYKRGVVWLRRNNPARQLKNLQSFLKSGNKGLALKDQASGVDREGRK